MTKKLLILFAALMAVAGVQAKTVIFQLGFESSTDYGYTYAADNASVSGSTATFNADWANLKWTFTNPINLQSIVSVITSRQGAMDLKLTDANGKIGYIFFWGTDNVNSTTTSFSGDGDNNKDFDATKIKEIQLDNRNDPSGGSKTANVSITISRETGYDDVVTYPTENSELFPLTAEGFNATIHSNTDTGNSANTYDATTKTLTYKGLGNQSGWTFDTKDLSAYNKLVIELQENLPFSPQFRFRNAAAYTDGKTEHYIGLPTDRTRIEIDLTAAQFEYDGIGENAKVALTLTDINGIYFWGWNNESKQIKLSRVYMVSASGKTTYLTRQNSAADKYGTICLPFAASKPSNATVYEVTGVDSKSSPSALYISEVETMEAGRAYIFQSTDAQDITFTKTGDATNVESAGDGSSYGLVGTFATATVSGYMLHDGKWSKADNKTCKPYRAYLDISKATEKGSSSPAGARRMSIARGGDTTGIDAIESATSSDSNTYNLSGQRVEQPAKGVYVRGGKKMVVR